MSKKIKLAMVAAFVAIFGFGFGGSAFAQLGDLPGMDAAPNSGGLIGPAVGELGNADHGDCVEQLLDLPALPACRDAEGRVVMDLPALTLVGPRELPATGVNAGVLGVAGLAALAAGLVLSRRVRMAMAS